MHSVTSVVKRYPLVTFLILTYIFSWWGYLIPGLGLGQWPLGPLMAALIVVPLTGGKAGLKEWASRIVRWRVGLKWYAIALTLPVALAGAAASLNVLLGAPGLTFVHLGQQPDLPFEILFVFLVISLGEEPGWRGYALPRLLKGHSALSATLILAVFGVIWHVPLFLTGDSPWSIVPIIVAGYVFFTWLFNNTRGSVLIAMILHTSVGIIGPLVFAPMFSGADLARYTWLLAALYSLVGVVVVILAGPARLSRRPAAQLEATGVAVAQPLASQ
jgi:membrane protease YdiL (CAAX protease family)